MTQRNPTASSSCRWFTATASCGRTVLPFPIPRILRSYFHFSVQFMLHRIKDDFMSFLSSIFKYITKLKVGSSSHIFKERNECPANPDLAGFHWLARGMVGVEHSLDEQRWEQGPVCLHRAPCYLESLTGPRAASGWRACFVCPAHVWKQVT